MFDIRFMEQETTDGSVLYKRELTIEHLLPLGQRSLTEKSSHLRV